MVKFQKYNKRINAWVKMERYKGKVKILNVKEKYPGKPFKNIKKIK